jgi:hypothetical protein
MQRYVLVIVGCAAIHGTTTAQAAPRTTTGGAVRVTRVPLPQGSVSPPPFLVLPQKGHRSPHRSYVVTLCTVMDTFGLIGAGSTASAAVSIDGGCARGVRVEDDGPRLSLCGVVLNSALAWWPFALLLWLPFDSCR